MAIISDDGRKLLSIPDRVAAPAEERAQAYSTFMAYAGKYTFSGDKVVHHIEVASLQNWVNTDQTRFVTLRGNRLYLRNTPPVEGRCRSNDRIGVGAVKVANDQDRKGGPMKLLGLIPSTMFILALSTSGSAAATKTRSRRSRPAAIRQPRSGLLLRLQPLALSAGRLEPAG